jgi:hypothetical protein
LSVVAAAADLITSVVVAVVVKLSIEKLHYHFQELRN